MTDTYIRGRNDYFQCLIPQSLVTDINLIPNTDFHGPFHHENFEVIDMAGTFERTFIVTKNNTFIYTQGTNNLEELPSERTLPIEIIKCKAGSDEIILLGKDQSVWIIGKTLGGGQINELVKLHDQDAIDIASGRDTSYILTIDNNLISRGASNEGQCGDIESNYNFNTQSLNKTINFPPNIIEIYSGPISYCLFCIDEDRNVFSTGRNAEGQLGLGHSNSTQNFERVRDIPQIQLCAPALHSSNLLSVDGSLWGSGDSHSGLGENYNKFHQLDTNDIKFIDLRTGSMHALAISTENEVYFWVDNTIKKVLEPQFSSDIGIMCGPFYSIVYNKCNVEGISQDWINMLESGLLSDLKIGDFNVHKLIWNLTVEEDFDFLLSLSNQGLKNFVYNVYSMNPSKSFNFGMIKRTLKESLLKLFLEKDDSFDFTIFVEDYGEKVPIYCHKLVIMARSGFFKGMLTTVHDESNTLNDVSGMSIEGWEALLRFIYEGPYELGADDDPELISNELQDAQEFFQINGLEIFLSKINNKYSFKSESADLDL